ncbi:MAG: thioredoxin domain-containing protein [Gemmatimonadetes bacterium]|nr:thioredoxin domain-containing protein [Gemmatimonadota bacterium]
MGGFLDDYAGLGNALLDLHEATLEARWLREVPWAVEAVLERFWEDDQGAFFDAAAGGEELVVRPRDAMDNPTPSGTSLATELLLRGALVLARDDWRGVAGRALAREAGAVERYPLAFGSLLSALDFRLSAPVEVAIVGDPAEEATRTLLRTVHARYLPRKAVVGLLPGEKAPLESPLFAGRETLDGRPTGYVCRNYACRRPATDPGELHAHLDRSEEPAPT